MTYQLLSLPEQVTDITPQFIEGVRSLRLIPATKPCRSRMAGYRCAWSGQKAGNNRDGTN